jgi:hypothetical protein
MDYDYYVRKASSLLEKCTSMYGNDFDKYIRLAGVWAQLADSQARVLSAKLIADSRTDGKGEQ